MCGDAVNIALDRDGCRKTGDGERAVKLGEGIVHGRANPMAGVEEGAGSEYEEQQEGRGDSADEAARGQPAGWSGFRRRDGSGSKLEFGSEQSVR